MASARGRPCRRAAFAAAIAIALIAIGRPARAHAVGLSRGEYRLTGNLVTAQLTFARGDAAGFDAEALVRGVVVRMNERPCRGAVEQRVPAEPDGVAWHLRFICEDPGAALDVRLPLFDVLPTGHRHAARVSAGDRAADDVLYRRHDAISFRVGGATTRVVAPRASATALGLLRMGTEHILTGYDHLAFLLGVLVVGGRLRQLLAVVTAFTIAHSMTLAVAVLGVWHPPARWIEPAIALSIAYVGLENFFVGSAAGRWRITFPFGLVHGFGFAGALQAVALPRAEVPAALLSFNVGVELGQLIVLAALLPLLSALRRSERFAGVGVRALSAATVAAGVIWFVARVAMV